MKLSSIFIQNFRNINELNLNFSDFNVLVGENNVGKTNILMAIYKVLKMNESLYRVKFSEEDFYLDKGNNRAEKIVIELTFTELNENDEVAFVSTGIDIENDKLTIRLEADWDNENNDANVEIFFLREDDSKNEKGEPFKLSHKKYIPFYYIDAYRDIWKETQHSKGELRQIFKEYNQNFLKPIEIQVKKSIRKLKDYLDNEPDETYISNINNLLENLENNDSFLDTDLEALPEELEDVKEILFNINHKIAIQEKLSDLQEIISGLEGMNKIKESLEDNLSLFVPESTESDLEIGKLSEYDLLDDTKIFIDNNPVFKQGSGFQNSFVIALKLSHLLANIKYSEEEITNLIIAIEEPEAHMHPHLQRSFISKLKVKQKEFFDELSINVQFIITTHSPFVLSRLDKSDISLIKNDENKFNIISLDNKFIKSICDKLSRNQLKHFDFLFRNYPEIFLSRGVIIVEGHSEFGAMPEMANKILDIDLDGLGLTVIRVDGKRMLKSVYTIIKQFTTCVAIRDKDKDKNDDEELVLNPEEPYYTTNKNDFEDEIVNSVDNLYIVKKILMNLNHTDACYVGLIKKYVPESISMSLNEILDKWESLDLQDLKENIDKEKLAQTLKENNKNALFWSIFCSEITADEIPQCYIDTLVAAKSLVI